MTSPGGNIVEIRVIARDMTGPGFDTATRKAKGLAAAVAVGPGSVATAMQTAERRASGLGATLRGVGEVAGGVLVAGVVQQMAQRAVALVKSTAEAASGLNESVNAVNKTFGEGTDEVLAWGKANANALGMSQRAFNQSATVLGAMLKNQGLALEDVTTHTTKLAERAADMASVFNTDVGDALAAIQAGLRGEIDPLERYGVSLSAAAVEQRALADTGKTATRELTNTDKALARLAVLYEQTNDVAGDFRGTSDGMANAQRIATATIEDAKAKIGTAFMPVMAKASQVTGKFAETFANMPSAIQQGTIAIVGLGAAAGFVAPVIVRAQTSIAALNAQLAATGPLGAKAATGLSAVTAAAGPLGVALAGAGLSYSHWADRLEDDKPLSNLEKIMLAATTTKIGMKIWDALTPDETVSGLLKESADAIEDVGEEAHDAAKSVEELNKEFDDLIDNAFDLEESQDDAADAIQRLKDQVKDEGHALTGNSQAARDNREAVRDLVQKYKDLMIETQKSGGSVEGLSQQLEDQLTQMGFNREEVKKYTDMLAELEEQLNNIPKNVDIKVNVNAGGRVGVPLLENPIFLAHGGITGAAGGGPRSRRTVVGEHGPELVDLAPGSMVHSAEDSSRLLAQGGGDVNIVLSFQPTGISWLDALLSTISAEVQKRGGNGSVLGIRTVNG